MHFSWKNHEKKIDQKIRPQHPYLRESVAPTSKNIAIRFFFSRAHLTWEKKNGRCCHCTELSPRIAKFSFCFDRIREKQSFDAGWSGIGSVGPFQRILAFWREKVKKSKKSIQIWDFGFELRMYLEAKLHAVPVTMVIWTLTGWLTCYLVAVGCGHVDPLLPLISMCGIRW